MADKPLKTNNSPLPSPYPHIKEREEKEGGKVYTLKEEYKVQGQKVIQPGSKFIECKDGWYQVYNERGVRMWYRVGPRIIGEVFGTGVHDTI